MAGFHVTGVDHNPHPRYCGDRFIQANALGVPLDGYDFIWASPPCQKWSALARLRPEKEYPDLIGETRERLLRSGTPYAIENVEDAPLGDSGYLIVLCGTMFGLETADGRAELRRHRIFETSFSIPLRPRCQHGYRQALPVTGSGLGTKKVLTVTGHTPVDNTYALRTISVIGNSPECKVRQAITVAGERAMGSQTMRRSISVTGSTPVNRNFTREVFSVNDARAAMGIDWMTMKGLSQAIPPAYSKFIAEAFLRSQA